MGTEIQTTSREIVLDGVQIAEWQRGSENKALINIQTDFMHKMDIEELFLRDAEMLNARTGHTRYLQRC
jgi:hypothetical protein